ncbi:MAG: hypothetical protein JXA33_03450 [Anaerolineae bacterium]|nr:hypothetical protein [Anaerolineae bacterium]
MKLPEDTRIAPEKLTQYLLVWRKNKDKSKWLARAGYTLANWRRLEADLRQQILSREAVPTESTQFGQMYEIAGQLQGPNGVSLNVRTIWMTEIATQVTKLITIFPDKRVKS